MESVCGKRATDGRIHSWVGWGKSQQRKGKPRGRITRKGSCRKGQPTRSHTRGKAGLDFTEGPSLEEHLTAGLGARLAEPRVLRQVASVFGKGLLPVPSRPSWVHAHLWRIAGCPPDPFSCSFHGDRAPKFYPDTQLKPTLPHFPCRLVGPLTRRGQLPGLGLSCADAAGLGCGARG